MPLSVSEAEAGLLAAPWAAAAQDPTLEQAAKNFYAMTADLTQHGKHDHPTDRLVLEDTAATLALELGAQSASSRAASISEYIKLPGSGDGFTITVFADGHQNLKRDAGGPDGVDTAPGADAALAQYGAVIGHTPSQDELAGFLAARVAGDAAPAGGTDSAGGAAPAGGGSSAPAVLTVTGTNGAVLASGTAAALLGQWSSLVALNNGDTPTINLPGRPPLHNATQSAACLLGLAMQSGTVSTGLVRSYNTTVSWLSAIDQPMLAVAAHYEALAKADAAAGVTGRVTLDQTAAHLALRIAAEPEGTRGSLSQMVHVDGHDTKVTVSQTTTDLTGGAQFHDIDNTNIGGIIEQVVGIVADVLSFTPLAPIAVPVAVAVSAAEAGQSFADGNVLGGVLSLGSAAGAGLGAIAAAGNELGLTASEAAQFGQASKLTLEGTGLVGGVAGAVRGAENGDGLGIAAGLLQAGSAAASGLLSSGAVTNASANTVADVATGARLASAGLSSSAAFLRGDVVGGLGGSLGALLAQAMTLGQRQSGSGGGDAPIVGTAGSSVAPVQQQDLPAPGEAPVDWQSAAAIPVQQQDLPPPGLTDIAGSDTSLPTPPIPPADGPLDGVTTGNATPVGPVLSDSDGPTRVLPDGSLLQPVNYMVGAGMTEVAASALMDLRTTAMGRAALAAAGIVLGPEVAAAAAAGSTVALALGAVKVLVDQGVLPSGPTSQTNVAGYDGTVLGRQSLSVEVDPKTGQGLLYNALGPGGGPLADGRGARLSYDAATGALTGADGTVVGQYADGKLTPAAGVDLPALIRNSPPINPAPSALGGTIVHSSPSIGDDSGGTQPLQGPTGPTAAAGSTPPEDPEDPAAKARQDRLDSIQSRIDNQKGTLDEAHLDAAQSELNGEVVKINPRDGQPFDHVTEVQNAQQGLRNVIKEINDALGYPKLDPVERTALTDKLGQASRLLDYSERFVPR